MGLKPLLACLLLVSLAFAGCSDNGGDGDDDDAISSSASSSTADKANSPPTATLTASALNGTSPFNVTFTLEGSDPDGDAITWTLVFGDGGQSNGTALPANATHVYTTASSLTVLAILTVSDGTLDAAANVTLEVAPPPTSTSTTTVFEGEVSLPCDTPGLCYVIGANGCVGWNLQQQGLECIWFELAPELVGLPFETDSEGDVDLDFRSDCELTGESRVIFGEDGQESGDVPDGAGCVVLSDFVAAGVLRILIG